MWWIEFLLRFEQVFLIVGASGSLYYGWRFKKLGKSITSFESMSTGKLLDGLEINHRKLDFSIVMVTGWVLAGTYYLILFTL